MEAADGLGKGFSQKATQVLGRPSGGSGGWSAQSQDVSLLPVLHGIGVPTGALVPDVAGHGEGNHLGGTQARKFSVLIGLTAQQPHQCLDSTCVYLFMQSSENKTQVATDTGVTSIKSA